MSGAAGGRGGPPISVLDEVRVTHERVVITRNGRPEAVLMAMGDLEALEEALDLLSTSGAIEQIRQAEGDLATGEGIDADELRRQLAARSDRGGVADQA